MLYNLLYNLLLFCLDYVFRKQINFAVREDDKRHFLLQTNVESLESLFGFYNCFAFDNKIKNFSFLIFFSSKKKCKFVSQLLTVTCSGKDFRTMVP